MNIVIVGGGTAGWMTALLASTRHPNHNITVIESTKIGVIGVGESTTGLLTDILVNFLDDFGCDHDEFIVETGSTLKYAIKHKGWTNNIDDYYLGPIDGSESYSSVPDPMFIYGLSQLSDKDIIKVSKCGRWINDGMANFDKNTKQFTNHKHAMHVDAHLVGKYFKKVCSRKHNVTHIDSEVTNVNLKENGFIDSVKLASGEIVGGDFFIDCSGFNRVLINAVNPGKWISYQKNLPLNTGLPFLLKYKENEIPEPYTTAWAQKNGWMWQIPLMDRKGCGYVFCDAFTTPDKAQEEIETILGQEIEPVKVIKFDTGRQETLWVNNCLTIGLSAAFLEPLEATSIHSSVVLAKNFTFEYLKSTLEDTLNSGSMKIYNNRAVKMFDDVRDFLVMHYMGGRTDSDFWKFINTGVTKTEYVSDLMDMAKTRIPTMNDFPQYYGSAGWPLYSFVMAGLGMFDKSKAINDLNINVPGYGHLDFLTRQIYHDNQDSWAMERRQLHTYEEFIKYFRDIRTTNGF